MVIYSRNPRNFWYPQLGGALSLKFVLRIDDVERYTITKNFSNGDVLVEYAELIRDYIEIEYDNEESFSVKVDYDYITYDGLNGTGSELSNNTSGDLFFSDGYGYFEEGEDGNFSNGVGLMQTNNVVYKYADADVRIAIDRNEVDSVAYLYKGEIVRSETITSSSDYAFKYIGNNVDSFEDRVFKDGGVYEENECIKEFIGDFELFDVDKINISLSNGDLETVKVINVEECRFTPAKVSFVNKFGAIQDVWFFKKSIETLNTKRETFNRFSINNRGQYNTNDHQKKAFNVGATKSIKLNTGYVDESYNTIMQEIMQSEQVWMKMDEVVTPMNVKGNSLTFKTSVNDKLVDYSLDLEYSFSVINNVR